MSKIRIGAVCALRRLSAAHVQGHDGPVAALPAGVRVTGIGLRAEQLGKVFEAFTQASASTSRTYGGTMLGLAISRTFSRMMGGDIEVESEFDRGARFLSWFPMNVTDGSIAQP